MSRSLSVKVASTLLATCLAFSLQAGSAQATSVSAAAKVSALKPGAIIGQLYVPRYGKKYKRTIAEGTTMTVLNGPGLGHYTGTQMPGDEGNFAIAGHRFGNGGPMLLIDKLKTGDLAYVKTSTTWYTYHWVGTKIVKPSYVGVVYPVPEGLATAAQGGHYMTFTSCTPVHINTLRIAAWFELDEVTPVADGMPAALSAALK
jgi:sortase A